MKQENLIQPTVINPIKRNNFLIYLLTGFLTIFIFLSGYFAYTHTKAQKEIEFLNEQVKNLEEQIELLHNEIDVSSSLYETDLNERDETESWEIYHDEIYGYEIRYPKNSQMDKLTNKKERIAINLSPDLSPFSSGEKGMRIRVATPDYVGCTETSLVNNYNVKFCVDEYTGGSEFGTWKFYEYFTKAKVSNEYIVIQFSLNVRQHQDYEDIDMDKEPEPFNQILSTFKFID